MLFFALRAHLQIKNAFYFILDRGTHNAHTHTHRTHTTTSHTHNAHTKCRQWMPLALTMAPHTKCLCVCVYTVQHSIETESELELELKLVLATCALRMQHMFPCSHSFARFGISFCVCVIIVKFVTKFSCRLLCLATCVCCVATL